MTAHKYVTREALETWFEECCAKIVDLKHQLNRTKIQLLDMENERDALRAKCDALEIERDDALRHVLELTI